MDMLAYFLGRLAGGGAGGTGEIISYDEISYGKDADGNDVLILKDGDTIVEAKCFYEDGKLKTVFYQGKEIELRYEDENNPDRLTHIGDMEIDLSNAPVVEAGGTGSNNISFDKDTGIINLNNPINSQGILTL
jgi:hypothetical protein